VDRQEVIKRAGWGRQEYWWQEESYKEGRLMQAKVQWNGMKLWTGQADEGKSIVDWQEVMNGEADAAQSVVDLKEVMNR
jgi:hypothetical protein